MEISSADYTIITGMCSQEVEVFTAAGTRLYSSTGGSWEYSGVVGAATVLADGDSYYIRIFGLDTQKAYFEQELYQGFNYSQPKPWFHTWESNDCVYGLSFAVTSEAATFFENLSMCCDEMGGTASVGDAPAAPAAAYSAPAPAPTQSYAPPVAAQPAYSAPAAAPYSAPVAAAPAAAPAPAGPSYSAPMQTTPIQQSSPDTGAKNLKNSKKKKKGLFGRFRKGGNKSAGAALVIGGPTGFKHESHIGWDLDNGFDIRNIPPEWKKLFQAAGVKKSDLQDAETRKLIVKTVGAALGGDPNAPPPPMMGGGMGGGGPPAPPGPPPPGPPPPPAAAPPPPGPPPPSAPRAPGPPPPGPPPPSASAAPATGGLLAQLSAKKGSLKSVDERETPDISELSTGQGASLANTLAQALQSRRVNLDAEEEGGDNSDEWSDDWSDG